MAKKDAKEERIRITNVDVRNVKRVSIATVPIEKATTIVGGKNAQGKSSFLDAIAMALGGKRLCPDRPLKDGEVSGEVSVTVEGCHPRLPGKHKITRSFKRKKHGNIDSELTIINVDDGSDANEPQTILNDMISASMWDPTHFIDQTNKKQFEHLRQMLGIDTDALESRRKQAYDERTGIGRKVNEAKVKVKDTYVNPDEIVDEVSITELVAERDVQVALQQDHEGNMTALATTRDDISNCQNRIDEIREEIERLESALERERTSLINSQENMRRLDGRIEDLEGVIAETDIDAINSAVDDYVAKIKEAEATNQMRQKMLQKKELHEDMQRQLRESEDLYATKTEEIEDIDLQKNRILAEIDWPVEGMEFDFEHQAVLFNGVPLSQASSAEQTRVAVGIELAEDRPLPVLIVKNGSLLDDVNLAMVAQLVAEKGGQLFVERVGKGEECTIVFEDGVIVGGDDGQEVGD